MKAHCLIIHRLPPDMHRPYPVHLSALMAAYLLRALPQLIRVSLIILVTVEGYRIPSRITQVEGSQSSFDGNVSMATRRWSAPP